MGTAKRERKKANRELARQARVRRERMSVVRKRGILAGLGVPLLVLALFGLAKLKNGGDGTDAVVTSTTLAGRDITGETPCPAVTGEERVANFEKAPPMCIDPSKSYVALLDTTEGEIEVELDAAARPGTVNNFVVLARYHYYDGTTFFRTNTDIDIIQGGGLSNTDGPGYTIADEGSGFTYSAGDLVMANGGQPNTGSAQFFFGAGPKVSKLDTQGSYVTFGRVKTGLDVLERIMALHTGLSSAAEGAPSRTVTLRSVTILEG